jgi:molybdenum cofactor cytidylyltransferase
MLTFRAFAVVPAAGRSVRMGKPKLLLPWGKAGATVIEGVLAAWRASSVERIVVVTHPGDSQLAEICRAAGADVHPAPTPPPDMKASIRYGLEHLARTACPADHDAWLVAPADLPLLTTATIERVIAAYDPASRRAVRPRHRGKFGHPVLWPYRAAALVAALPADRGLDALFEASPFDANRYDSQPFGVPAFEVVECGPDAVGDDVDTPDEYRRLRDRYDRNDS